MKNNSQYPTDEQLVKYLDRQIDIELMKPIDKQDMDFIDECSAFISDILGKCDLPDEQIKSQKCLELYDNFKKSQKKTMHKQKMKRFVKQITVAACIVLFLITVPVFISAAVNGVSPLAVFEKFGRNIFGIAYGECIDVNGITFIRYDNVKQYDTFDELMQKEKLNILYPTKLPLDIYISRIIMLDEAQGSSVMFVFNTDDIYYNVELYEAYNSIGFDYTNDTVDINDIRCYISLVDEKYNAIFMCEGYSYSVSARSRDTLVQLLNWIIIKND